MILRVYENLDSDYSVLSDYSIDKLHIDVNYRSKLHSNTYYVSEFESGTIVYTLSTNRITHELEKR